MGEKKVWGEYRAHGHCSSKNVINLFLTINACVPSILWVAHVRRACLQTNNNDDPDRLDWLLYRSNPNALLHVLFFLNISFGFWVVGLLQKSFWLIDPYWTLFPPLAGLFYASRPEVEYSAQLVIALLLLVVWSLRLTLSYFRRENFKFGEREDWRYTDMAKRHGKHWWWISFFAVGVAQQFMLCPLVYPMYSLSKMSHHEGDRGGVIGMFSVVSKLTCLDWVAIFGSVLGLTIAYFADNQLHSYCKANSKVKEKIGPILNYGLWGLSRHPNYLGEQIWWWSFSLFSVARGDYAALIGPFINSCVLVHVTRLTEEHMLSTWDEKRAKLYLKYAETTPAWLSLPF
jgi:steroid 5-alpha reductase family enzyme